MRGAAILLAGLTALTFAAPATAQSAHGAHSAQPEAAEAPQHAPPVPVCTPEHAAMGHCTLEPETDHDAHAGHDMPAPAAPAAADPACPPEHAAMGHCTPGAAPPPSHTGAVGTDLPPGNAPAPPQPSGWYADRIFPAAEMERARHRMMAENGAQAFGYVSLDLEYRSRREADGLSWDGEAWYGDDIDRLTIKSEGESAIGEGLESGEAQLLYSRAIGPYFNAQAGVRQDYGRGPDRIYATIGVEGLAPYWFEVEGALFLSDKGDVLARAEAEYDQRITQRLVLQPAAEMSFALQDMPAQGIGSGLSEIELGLRLRYEIVREFAPYVGIGWARRFGDTARFARAASESPESTSLLVGLRAWF